MIKALFFDVDDTLLDFTLCSKLALQETCKAFNINYTSELFTRFETINKELWAQFDKGQVSREYIMQNRFKLILNDNIYEYTKINDYFLKTLSQTAVLTNNAYSTINKLAKHYNLYVASNSSIDIQMNRLIKANIYHHFKNIFCSHEIGASKPSKSFFDHCINSCKYQPEEILMIGDNIISDIKGAHNAMIKTCLYDPNHQYDSTIECDYHIDDLNKLLNILCRKP